MTTLVPKLVMVPAAVGRRTTVRVAVAGGWKISDVRQPPLNVTPFTSGTALNPPVPFALTNVNVTPDG